MSETHAPTLADYDKAIDTLDGTISIARNEMLAHAGYISPSIVNSELAKQGSVCRGHQACLIGSMWLAGGVRRTGSRFRGYDLPSVSQGSERDRFLARRPGLLLAYDATNAAAERYMKRTGIKPGNTITGFLAPAEHLFEEGLLSTAGKRQMGVAHGRPSESAVRKEMIKVLRGAKRSLVSKRDKLAVA